MAGFFDLDNTSDKQGGALTRPYKTANFGSRADAYE
jgi:hypothetical protein